MAFTFLNLCNFCLSLTLLIALLTLSTRDCNFETFTDLNHMTIILGKFYLRKIITLDYTHI